MIACVTKRGVEATILHAISAEDRERVDNNGKDLQHLHWHPNRASPQALHAQNQVGPIASPPRHAVA